MRQAGPRFNIRSLMLAVAVVAGLLALALSPNGLAIAVGLLYLSLSGVLWWMFYRYRKLAAMCLGVVSAVTMVWCAAFCVYLLNYGGFFWMIVVWLLAFPMIVGAGGAWAAAATRRTSKPRRSPFLAWPLVLVLAFAPLSMMLTHWPLRLAFLASRPAMERLANRVALGERISRPEWAGVFRVIGSSLEPGSLNVGLIIDADPAGRSGFVRLGAGVPETDTHGPFYNLNFNEPLGRRWFYQNED
jgi:hypothetical protein